MGWATAKRIADLLVEGGWRWAVLHGVSQLNAGVVGSDVDVACDVDGPTIFAQLRSRLRSNGLQLIMMTRYDIGRAHALWLLSAEDESLLQFDVLCDRDGIGRLGIPTGLALGRSDAQGPFPGISPEWGLTYEVSKRLGKRQWDRLAQLSTGGLSEAKLRPVLSEVFGERSGRRCWGLLADGADANQWRRESLLLRSGRLSRRARRARWHLAGLAVARVARALSRLRNPVGFWAHYHGPESSAAAEHVYDAIAKRLPASFLGEVPCRRLPIGLARSIVPVLMRPGVAVTWSIERREWPFGKPHFEAEVRSASDWSRATADLAAAMARRVEAHGGCGSAQRR